VLAEALAEDEQDREIEHLTKLAEKMGDTEAAIEELAEATRKSAAPESR
jgi:hypothetical protein